MRVPLPITIASCLAVVFLTWWWFTRSRDFMTPPDERRLAEVRQRVATATPTPEGVGDALSPADPRQTRSGPVPVVLPRHIESKPQIDDYAEEARHGSEYLIGLARLLDANGHPERSLLCSERVLDSTNAEEAQRQWARHQIQRLRSTESGRDHPGDAALPLVIHAGTGPAAAARLRPLLEAWAQSVGSLSHGIVRAEADVVAGDEELGEPGQAPVALWITGPGPGAPSTEIFSFTLGETPDLKRVLGRELHRIIRHQISRHTPLTPPETLPPDGDAEEALRTGLTRLSWMKFGQSLQARP